MTLTHVMAVTCGYVNHENMVNTAILLAVTLTLMKLSEHSNSIQALVALSVTGAFLVAKCKKYCSLVAMMYNTTVISFEIITLHGSASAGLFILSKKYIKLYFSVAKCTRYVII